MKQKLKDEKARYGSGRLKPTSRTIATSKGTNREHWKMGIAYAKKKIVSRGKLRILKQKSMADYFGMSEKKCHTLLSFSKMKYVFAGV